MLPPAPRRFYALQQRVNKTARNEVARLWRGMGADFEAGWRRVGPQVVTVLATAQLKVAEASMTYLDDLAEQTTPSEPQGQLVPHALVGYASDGRPLDSLTYGAVVQSGTAFNEGATQAQALRAGGQWLDMVAALQVADAARTATSIGGTIRPQWGGYTRHLNPPSCSRCAVLAGKWFRWNTGFRRHPRCDCMHVPGKSAAWAEAEGFIGNPDQAWRSGHITDLTATQRQALDDGADLTRLVNAQRGMTSPWSSRLRAGARPTPELIYRLASDRADAIRLLRIYGYVRT